MNPVEPFVRLASTRNMLLAVVVSLLASVALFQLGPYGPLRSSVRGPLPEEMFRPAVRDIGQRLQELGVEGRQRYRRFQALDLGNALLTTLALMLLIARAARGALPARPGAASLALLPLALFGAECTENLLLMELARADPSALLGAAAPGFVGGGAPALAAAASWVVSAKLVLGGASFAAALLLLLAWAGRALSARFRG